MEKEREKMEVIEIKEEEFERKALKSNKKVLVDFYANWCGPCRMLSPVVEELAREMEEVEFYKINVDDAEEVSRKYGVMSIPTLILFQDGKVMNQSVGLKSKQELKEFLKD